MMSAARLDDLQVIGTPILAIDAVELLLDAEIAMESGNVRRYSQIERAAITKASLRTTWIYFIASVDYGSVKIGRAKNPANALTRLSAHSPVPLQIAAAIRFLPVCETWLHEQFKDLRLHGEWFKASPDLVDMMRAAKSGGARAVLEKLSQTNSRKNCINTVL